VLDDIDCDAVRASKSSQFSVFFLPKSYGGIAAVGPTRTGTPKLLKPAAIEAAFCEYAPN
jgi:hypothetical protein